MVCRVLVADSQISAMKVIGLIFGFVILANLHVHRRLFDGRTIWLDFEDLSISIFIISCILEVGSPIVVAGVDTSLGDLPVLSVGDNSGTVRGAHG